MAFFESAVSVLETVMIALEAGIKALGEMNEKGKFCKGHHKCHAVTLPMFHRFGYEVLMPRTMKPPPRS